VLKRGLTKKKIEGSSRGALFTTNEVMKQKSSSVKARNCQEQNTFSLNVKQHPVASSGFADI
jgi:hypothetical protein